MRVSTHPLLMYIYINVDEPNKREGQEQEQQNRGDYGIHKSESIYIIIQSNKRTNSFLLKVAHINKIIYITFILPSVTRIDPPAYFVALRIGI